MADLLQGRTVVITGAARGLGRAFAWAAGLAGARLVVADILAEQCEATATDLREAGFEARAISVDLGNPESIAALAVNIQAVEGHIDGLINNGAIATNVGGMAFEDIPLDLWDRVQIVNVRGSWLMIKALSPLMAEGGRIVNLASDTALWGAPKLLSYVASKGAIIAMTRSLSRELGPRGIGITAIAPGIVRVEATEYVPAQRHELYEQGRAVPGPQKPEDITAVATFLLSEGALSLTGQVLPVNGGFVFT